MDPPYVLVTGATGFIGAHVVDELLRRGIRVRGATRSHAKGQAMLEARLKFASHLDFVQIEDFEKTGVFRDVIKDIDSVIHVQDQHFKYDTKNNEQELIIPAINGVRSILEAAVSSSSVKRVVATSSFASVIDKNRKGPPYFTYTGKDWNPLTYAEAIDPSTNAVVAYRGSKKFAELEVWKFVEKEKPTFDIVTLCPPMTFGPVVHPVRKVEKRHAVEGCKRDLAKAHVEALLRPEAGNKRYIPAAPERFSYQLAAEIMVKEFPWAEGQVANERTNQSIDDSHGVDGAAVAQELGVHYRTFRDTVVDLISQVVEQKKKTP